MKITPDNQNLFTLVEKAQKKQLILPEFQRSFVWPYTDIKDLLISIFKGYYIGSLLLLDADSKSLPFAFRPIEGADGMADENRIEKYILDGQQRITTLHYVLYGPEKTNLKNTASPYRFFLNLNDFMKDDLDTAIYAHRLQDCKKLIADKDMQYTKQIIPFTSLAQPAWQDWTQEYISLAANDAETAERAVNAMRWSDKLRPFFNFHTTTMTLGKVSETDEEGIAEICAVFEKMNTKGVKLTVFDLLTARLYRSGILLRQLWKNTYDNKEHINAFSDEDPGLYAILILRIIGLIRGLDVKASNLINLSPQDFEKDFVDAADALDRALLKIRNTQGYGVFDKKWLPYPPMAAPLAALITLAKTEKLDASATKAIDKWYWGSVFAERYSSGVESATARDYRDIRDYLIGKKSESEVLSEINNKIDEHSLINSLYGTSRARSSIYSGVMCLLAINGARDFRIDDPITLHTLDDHHIFPKDYLASKHRKTENRLLDTQINCILNRTLISDRTNRMISNKAPSTYINDPQIIDQQQRSIILGRHFVREEGLSAMHQDDYGAFQETRAREIVSKILARIN